LNNNNNSSLAVSNAAYTRVNNILNNYPAAQAADNELYFQDPNLTGITNKSSSKNSGDETRATTADEEEVYYFSKAIHNSGFWGKVRVRRGTWLVIVGLALMAAGIVLVGVFWNWWYGHAVNFPARTVAITVLSLGVGSLLLGLATNFAMQAQPLSRHFIGSPAVRWTSWLLLASIILIVIASDAITVYYTYWHNRWVNTPLICIAIIFYFFGGIGLIYTLYANVVFMNMMIAKANGTWVEPLVKEKKRPIYIEQGYLDEGFVPIGTEEAADTAVIVPEQIESGGEGVAVVDEAAGEKKKKDFRKKGIKLLPRANYLQEKIGDD
jgi:hypothetical protein